MIGLKVKIEGTEHELEKRREEEQRGEKERVNKIIIE